jgi:hypothetical protein
VFVASTHLGRFPKRVLWYQGAFVVGRAFGQAPPNGAPPVTASLTLSVTRWLWEKGFGAPRNEVLEGFGQLDAQIRLLRPLVLLPVGAFFVFDRDLHNSKATVGSVTFAQAPYPLTAFAGGSIGYDISRWMPYVTARRFFYAADIGVATDVGVGVQVRGGPADFVDAQFGFIYSDTHGKLRSPTLERIPIGTINIGWSL